MCERPLVILHFLNPEHSPTLHDLLSPIMAVNPRLSNRAEVCPLQDEGDVEHSGETAQPPEAHHPEDGDLLRGGRVRRSGERQRQPVAQPGSEQS